MGLSTMKKIDKIRRKPGKLFSNVKTRGFMCKERSRMLTCAKH